MLKVQDLHFSYDNKVTVLDHVSFEVAKGDMLALIGPNGCGKTTLIKLICDLLEKQKGSITINGVDSRDLAAKKRLLYLQVFCLFTQGGMLIKIF
ncbi:ATP-binding cassette domain-containing protein [Ectobacillus antri]|jgi:ABC-type multidrug transport system ATPase subunit|uniref:ATP-binding cassette domain-containing protein n=1 Tax=Ectobacillus antri TaxID=2486280 RepID=UPI000F5B65A6|nr:ATP-binding cassette domain-containing protein [Ectobacillus antri]